MNSFLKGLGYFGSALIFVLAAVYLSSWINGDKEVNQPPIKTIYQTVPRPFVTCSTDFISYQKLAENPSRIAKLIDHKKIMFAENGGFVNSEVVITKNETKESRVACGYLFVRAGTITNGSLQSWENVYINPSGFGGHISKENSIGLGDSREFSEYLFPLSKINYWKTRNDRVNKNLSVADWGVLLNVSDTVEFNIALNTEDKTGFIDDISIAYKCWNPETGEENDKCSLNVEKKPDTIKKLL